MHNRTGVPLGPSGVPLGPSRASPSALRAWHEAPANLLTAPAVDPLSKIPEYKVSAVNLQTDTEAETDSASVK
jgi:hypothetical protein